MEAGNAAKDGILRVYPEAEVFMRPLADGGEGTVDALTEGLGGRIRTISVSDPLGRPLQANYGILTSPGQGEPLAVIEMAGRLRTSAPGCYGTQSTPHYHLRRRRTDP